MKKEISEKRDEIILLGPMGVGKTTLALYLSEKLGILNYPIDRLKWYYRFKNGYDLAKGTRILKTSGFQELSNYFNDYFGNSELSKILDEFRGGIFDFGASHSYFEDFDQLHDAKKILSPFTNIFLLLPTDNFEKNCVILDKRIRKRYDEDVEWKRNVLDSYLEQNRIFLMSNSNYYLSKETIYTEGKTIEEIGKEILSKCFFLNDSCENDNTNIQRELNY